MIPGLVSRVLLSNNKNAPHLMAESGAWMPGYQKVKVVMMTITSVTVPLELHYPCQPAEICIEPLLWGIHEVISLAGKNKTWRE
jgi:hypothetical protein